jgi:hypothetical protein
MLRNALKSLHYSSQLGKSVLSLGLGPLELDPGGSLQLLLLNLLRLHPAVYQPLLAELVPLLAQAPVLTIALATQPLYLALQL